MTGYEKVKRMAKALQCNTADLLVLARQNDPFYVGSPTAGLPCTGIRDVDGGPWGEGLHRPAR